MTATQLLHYGHKSEILAFIYLSLSTHQDFSEYGEADIWAMNMTTKGNNPFLKEYDNRNSKAHVLARQELKKVGIKARALMSTDGKHIIWEIKKAA